MVDYFAVIVVVAREDVADVADQVDDFVGDGWREDVLILFACCHLDRIGVVFVNVFSVFRWLLSWWVFSLGGDRKLYPERDRVVRV